MSRLKRYTTGYSFKPQLDVVLSNKPNARPICFYSSYFVFSVHLALRDCDSCLFLVSSGHKIENQLLLNELITLLNGDLEVCASTHP